MREPTRSYSSLPEPFALAAAVAWIGLVAAAGASGKPPGPGEPGLGTFALSTALLLGAAAAHSWYVAAPRLWARWAMGGGITAAWLAMIVSGRWRPAPTWPDRLGRALGAAWLLLWLASIAVFLG